MPDVLGVDHKPEYPVLEVSYALLVIRPARFAALKGILVPFV
jgi:hypothetical protein